MFPISYRVTHAIVVFTEITGNVKNSVSLENMRSITLSQTCVYFRMPYNVPKLSSRLKRQQNVLIKLLLNEQ